MLLFLPDLCLYVCSSLVLTKYVHWKINFLENDGTRDRVPSEPSSVMTTTARELQFWARHAKALHALRRRQGQHYNLFRRRVTASPMDQ